MPKVQSNSRSSGRLSERVVLRSAFGVNVRVARREALNAAKRAHRMMELDEPRAADRHRRLMAVVDELDQILGGAS